MGGTGYDVIEIRLANLGEKPLIVNGWKCEDHQGGYVAVEAGMSERCFRTTRQAYNEMVGKGAQMTIVTPKPLKVPLPQ